MLTLFSFSFRGLAQDTGAVAGTVISSWDAAPLAGVVVSVRGTTLAAQTDVNGRYEIRGVAPGDQVLRLSKSGFATAVVTDVRVLPGQTTTLNGNLRPEFYEMEEYEVTAEEFQEQTEKILFERQSAGAMLDAIGSDQFSRLGAGDAGQIVARVTGVSVVGGKFAVVRGLSDRYTRTLLNSVEVPSADPYRMSPQLDLFPSAMIDRVSVSKTFTPDQPGGTGGGTIDIFTKPFPEEPFVKGGFGTSFNPESNLKSTFLADPRTSMDMFARPAGPAELTPKLFELTSRINRPNNAGTRETLANAVNRRQQAEAVSGLLRSLGTTDFGGVNRESPLNSSLNASAGGTTTLFGKPLGLFGALNYSRAFRLLEDYDVRSYGAGQFLATSGKETRSNINTDEGANVNIGYRLSDLAEFGFNFLYAHAVDEEARKTVIDFIESRAGDTLEKWQLHHTDREVFNYQFRGDHRIEALGGAHLGWTVGLADTSQSEPNHRFMNYFVDESGRYSFGDAALPVPQYPSRYYRVIDEQSVNTRADLKVPLGFLQGDSHVKFGWYGSSVERDFREQYFGYSGASGFNNSNPNSYLNDPALLEYQANWLGGIRTNYSWQRFVELVIGRPYTASQDITAGYAMLDVVTLPWLRVIGGARVERTDMEINARGVGTSTIQQTDLLPAAAVVFSVRTNVQLRVSYGETVARPSFREKAPISNYLPDLDLFAEGNPNLKMSSIRSYDARLEWFPAPGDVISVGVFTKDLKDPIELYRVDFQNAITWINRTEATVRGIEFEARKNLGFLSDHLRDLTLGVNLALIESETPLTDVEYRSKTDPDNDGIPNIALGPTRPLFDQSPYIANVDVTYFLARTRTTFTLAANLTGERIVLSTAQGDDIYEHPPVTLDAFIEQKLGKHLSLRLGIRNLLDEEYRQTYGPEYDNPQRLSYRRGRTYSLSLNASF
jgi:outer membrane receptor protein involved in Fe transport